MVLVKGTYDWLEEDHDEETSEYDMEEYFSKYNCRYNINEEEKVEVSCQIEQGPSVITHSRSSGVQREIKNISEDFFGVRGFTFVSETARPDMSPNEMKKALIDEIGGIFDFVRDPLD